MVARYAIGVDFGTASGRAILVDVADGRQVATAVQPYRHGVIDERLPYPDEAVALPPDWALQDPDDYLRVLQTAVPTVIRAADVDPRDVIGIGIDFTSCTMLPARADGVALAQLPEFRSRPARLGQALEAPRGAAPGRPDQRGRRTHRASRGSTRYGGRISSEWFFSKALQILDEAPGDLRRGRPPDRGRRLGRLAAHRGRDPQRVHGRLQGHVVQARRIPGRRRTSAALDPRFAIGRRRQDAPRPPAGGRPSRRALRGGGGLDRAAARDRGRGRERRCPRRRPGRDRHRSPAGW